MAQIICVIHSFNYEVIDMGLPSDDDSNNSNTRSNSKKLRYWVNQMGGNQKFKIATNSNISGLTSEEVIEKLLEQIIHMKEVGVYVVDSNAPPKPEWEPTQEEKDKTKQLMDLLNSF